MHNNSHIQHLEMTTHLLLVMSLLMMTQLVSASQWPLDLTPTLRAQNVSRSASHSRIQLPTSQLTLMKQASALLTGIVSFRYEYLTDIQS